MSVFRWKGVHVEIGIQGHARRACFFTCRLSMDDRFDEL